MEECREAYATWIELAQEVLKQKNLEESELAKKAIGYEDMLKGRKLMMAKTDGEEKPKMKGLNCSKSYKISCASATPGRSNKKLLDRRWKMEDESESIVF